MTRVPIHTTTYANSYMWLEIGLHILVVAVVLEIYRVALAKHPGLANFGRKSVWVAFAITLAIAAAGAVLDKDILSGQSAINHRFFRLERTLDLITFLFLLFIAIFISWFPIELPRNVALCIGGFSVYYFARAVMLLVLNLLPQRYWQIEADVSVASGAVILGVWAVLLRPNRSAENSVAVRSWDPAAFARVSHQLDTINSALVRFGRR